MEWEEDTYSDIALNVELSDITDGFTSGGLSSGFESQTPIPIGNIGSGFQENKKAKKKKTNETDQKQVYIKRVMDDLRKLAIEIDDTKWMFETVKVVRN